MDDKARIQQLLEETLQESRTPEDVCRDFPELLPEVRRRRERMRRVESQLEAGRRDLTPSESLIPS